MQALIALATKIVRVNKQNLDLSSNTDAVQHLTLLERLNLNN